MHDDPDNIRLILKEILSINDKLSTLVRVEERVMSLDASRKVLEARMDGFEVRERSHERDLSFAVQQAQEFREVKNQITTNSTNGQTIQKVFNWAGGIVAALLIAGLVADRASAEDTTVIPDFFSKNTKVALIHRETDKHV